MTETEAPTLTLEDRVYRTFYELNTGIQRWFNGTVPDTDQAFVQLTDTLHSDFTYVYPSGAVTEYAEFWRNLRSSWGANREIRLATPRRHTRLLLADENSVVAEAIELQRGARAVERSQHARRSTLIFFVEERARYGLQLWRLHETIMPPEEEGDLDWSELDH